MIIIRTEFNINQRLQIYENNYVIDDKTPRTFKMKKYFTKEILFIGILILIYPVIISGHGKHENSGIVALWLFDEQQTIYPSSVLNDSSPNNIPLVIGMGGKIVKGKFGNALDPIQRSKINFPPGEAKYGLKEFKTMPGRKVPPIDWMNADFCAFMTMGQNQLRKDVGFVNPTKTKLNLGDFDWTVEFWFKPERNTKVNGVIFEIGQGPRGENNEVTRLSLSSDLKGFVLFNKPSGTRLTIPSNESALNPKNSKWHHFAFVYSSGKHQLYHYVDGVLQKLPEKCKLKKLSEGNEAYMSIGRDGLWKEPLQGRIDELRFSQGDVYTSNFKVPGSFSTVSLSRTKPINLKRGLPFLFAGKNKYKLLVNLGSRKYLFFDGAIISRMRHIKFEVNPPKNVKMVFNRIGHSFRKHLSVVQDSSGLIRIYNGLSGDYLGVIVSKDGVHFRKPDFGMHHKGDINIVITQAVGGLGNPFMDPNGPPSERWKLITGYHNRGIYLYTSPDGWHWKRDKTYLLPFRCGTQSCTFYDDQRGAYVGYHRSGIFHTPGGATQRSSVLTIEKDLHHPWKFPAISQKAYLDSVKSLPIREPIPWYLDNGPLTPGEIGLEFPHKFDPDSSDPVGTDIYVTKAQKYKWAPDAYFAFPIEYFHYEKDGPVERQILGSQKFQRGSGPIETQIAVSRDGVHWKRFHRPAYISIGTYCGDTLHQIYIADGMVRRGDEIWQYFFGNQEYHSSWSKRKLKQAVFRVVQRLDGFISADSPYDTLATIITKPLIFKGNRLVLNINTGATGYTQVGFLDQYGNPIKGYSVKDCIYINGNFVHTEVEWLKKGKDVSSLQGKPVRLEFRMRGTKLYSMRFVQ